MLYSKKTMSDYRRCGLTRNYTTLLKDTNMFSSLFFLSWSMLYTPLNKLVTCKKLPHYMTQPSYLYVLHQCVQSCSSYTLIICRVASGQLSSPHFKIQMALFGSGRGGLKTKTQRHLSWCWRCNNVVNDDFKWDNYGMVIKQETA